MSAGTVAVVQARAARTVLTGDGSYVVTAAPRAAVPSARWSGALSRACRRGARFVVLDLGDTMSLDTAGLALLVEVADALRADGGELCLVVTSPPLRRLMDATGADRRFAVCETVADGLERVAVR